jgi:hypothetical protein
MTSVEMPLGKFTCSDATQRLGVVDVDMERGHEFLVFFCYVCVSNDNVIA